MNRPALYRLQTCFLAALIMQCALHLHLRSKELNRLNKLNEKLFVDITGKGVLHVVISGISFHFGIELKVMQRTRKFRCWTSSC